MIRRRIPTTKSPSENLEKEEKPKIPSSASRCQSRRMKRKKVKRTPRCVKTKCEACQKREDVGRTGDTAVNVFAFSAWKVKQMYQDSRSDDEGKIAS